MTDQPPTSHHQTSRSLPREDENARIS